MLDVLYFILVKNFSLPDQFFVQFSIGSFKNFVFYNFFRSQSEKSMVQTFINKSGRHAISEQH